MVRMIGGVLAGLLLAMVVIVAVESLGHALFPMRADAGAPVVDRAAIMDAVPLPAKLSVLLGWFLGAFAGAWAADRIGRRGLAGYLVAALVVAGGVWTMVELPHPLWMQVAGVLLPFAAASAAERLSRRRF